MVKKTFLWVVLVGVMVSLVGCQTIQGIGGDMQWIGEKTTEAAGGF